MTELVPTKVGACQRRLIADRFIAMVPAIERVARFGLRRVPYRHRQELVADVISLAYAAFVRLVEREKMALAYPTVLARYALRRTLAGRKLGTRQNSQDMLSLAAQKRARFVRVRLRDVVRSGDDHAEDCWEDWLADRRTGPAEQAACRMDFQSWLATLQRFKRRIALTLVNGATTKETAKQYQLSAARISQLRRELAASWQAFLTVPTVA